MPIIEVLQRVFVRELATLISAVSPRYGWHPSVHPPCPVDVQRRYVEKYHLDLLCPEFVDAMTFCSGISDFTPGLDFFCCPQPEHSNLVSEYLEALERFSLIEPAFNLATWEPLETWVPIFIPEDGASELNLGAVFLLTSGVDRGKCLYLYEDTVTTSVEEEIQQSLAPAIEYLDTGDRTGWFEMDSLS